MSRPARFLNLLLLATAALALAACDLLGPDPAQTKRDADAKAIGAACRYGLRSIQDCYTLYPKVTKAAVYAGWLEMDAYMRENKIEGIRAELPVNPPKPAAPPPPAEEALADTPAAKGKPAAGH